MKKRCKVFIIPKYTYEGLSEKQFKALQTKMSEYPNSYYNYGIEITGYGGKRKYRRDYYFVLKLDTHVMNKEYFTVNRKDLETDDTLNKKLEDLLEYMDRVTAELEKIIEENEES